MTEKYLCIFQQTYTREFWWEGSPPPIYLLKNPSVDGDGMFKGSKRLSSSDFWVLLYVYIYICTTCVYLFHKSWINLNACEKSALTRLEYMMNDESERLLTGGGTDWRFTSSLVVSYCFLSRRSHSEQRTESGYERTLSELDMNSVRYFYKKKGCS